MKDWTPTATGQLRYACRMADAALDHWERSLVAGNMADVKRLREQAASQCGEAMAALARAAYAMAMEAVK
jgi:uncharacterized protein YacL (UPF0231 family)